MLTIDLKNVEDLVFVDKAAQQAVPGLRDLFHSWALGRLMPSLRPVAQRAVFEFFDRITPEQVAALAGHFGREVRVDGTAPHLVRHYSFSLEDSEGGLNEAGLGGNFFVWRDEGNLYVSTWR